MSGLMRVPAPAARILTHVLPVERLVYVSPRVCAGQFRCEPEDLLFRGGCCSGHTIVFPRTPVWIRHEGGRRRLIDASLITFYNRDQPYERWRARGADHCDWLAFPEATIREAVAAFDTGNAERTRGPFREGVGPSDPALYLRQRRLFTALEAGTIDPSQAEEEAMHLLGEALAGLYGRAERSTEDEVPSSRTREAIERVRELIAGDPASPAPLDRLAAEVRLSLYYLCHAFRRVTGMTMSGYRNRLRLMMSLEHFTPGADLTRVALDLGFSSHSHFTYAFRRTFGVPPSKVRPRSAR
jgi:AraC-like DNA-binding protein